jgi:hypothetical protein
MSEVFIPPGSKPFEKHRYVVVNDDMNESNTYVDSVAVVNGWMRERWLMIRSCNIRRERELPKIARLIRTISPLESLQTQQLREMERKQANTHESVRHAVDLALRKVRDGTAFAQNTVWIVAQSQFGWQWISQTMGNVASDADLRNCQREIAVAIAQAKKDTLASLRGLELADNAMSATAQAHEFFVQQMRQIVQQSVGLEAAGRVEALLENCLLDCTSRSGASIT